MAVGAAFVVLSACAPGPVDEGASTRIAGPDPSSASEVGEASVHDAPASAGPLFGGAAFDSTASTGESPLPLGWATWTSASVGPVERAASTERIVTVQEYVPFARRAGIDFLLPAKRVERVGYHQSGNDGARQFRAVRRSTPWTVLESRRRGTKRRTAADIVVAPKSRIVAPVSGTVVAANEYVLYCRYTDDLVFISPDARPDLVVKVLHIRGRLVSVGDRVEAGVTRIARRPRVLPFASQVEEVTSTPPWPHVHIEVVDPSIPDRPDPGGGCP